jgi:hypothetical protein
VTAAADNRRSCRDGHSAPPRTGKSVAVGTRFVPSDTGIGSGYWWATVLLWPPRPPVLDLYRHLGLVEILVQRPAASFLTIDSDSIFPVDRSYRGP